jgi:hypothetical protein
MRLKNRIRVAAGITWAAMGWFKDLEHQNPGGMKFGPSDHATDESRCYIYFPFPCFSQRF